MIVRSGRYLCGKRCCGRIVISWWIIDTDCRKARLLIAVTLLNSYKPSSVAFAAMTTSSWRQMAPTTSS